MPETKATFTPRASMMDLETITANQRLRRAMRDPEFLDEFLEKPKEIAKKFDISLTDEDIKGIQNVRQFLASWDFFCGEGQWVEDTRLDGRIPSQSPSIADMALECVRMKIADEILQDTPKAIRRIVSEYGSDVLVDTEASTDDLPEQIKPLARTLRNVVHSMTREVTRELYRTPISGATAPVTERQRFGATQSPETVGAESGLGAVLGHYLQDVVNHAAQEAVDHIRPVATSQEQFRTSEARAAGSQAEGLRGVQ